MAGLSGAVRYNMVWGSDGVRQHQHKALQLGYAEPQYLVLFVSICFIELWLTILGRDA